MAFNNKLNKSDIDFLDSLYKAAERSGCVEDWMYFQQQVEELIGDLDSPVEWGKYLRRIEEMYGYKNNKKGR